MKASSKKMRTGAILLVVALVVSCVAGGTLAKYVTEGQGNDSARVAKWGVKVEVTGGAFSTTYGKDNVSADASVGGNTVISSDEDNVVAPGTKGTFGGVKITGQPEVAVKVETTATVELSGWNVGDGGEFYCPLVFKIGDTTINGLDYSSNTAGGESSFENAIKTAIQNATTKELAANTDLSEVGESVTYSWEWPFEGNTGLATSQSNKLDTLLGNNAADNRDDNDPTINIIVKTTVTQID